VEHIALMRVPFNAHSRFVPDEIKPGADVFAPEKLAGDARNIDATESRRVLQQQPREIFGLRKSDLRCLECHDHAPVC
jgi:hypothetical protein